MSDKIKNFIIDGIVNDLSYLEEVSHLYVGYVLADALGVDTENQSLEGINLKISPFANKSENEKDWVFYQDENDECIHFSHFNIED